MSSAEQYTSPSRTIMDRDYIAKRDELIARAADYIDGYHMWARDFYTDMTELGYELEYTEALAIVSDAQAMPWRLRAAQEEADELASYEEQEWQFEREQARNGQEERI